MLDSFFDNDEKFENSGKMKPPINDMEKSTFLRAFSQQGSTMRSSTLLASDHELLDKNFLYILRRLLPAKNSLYSLRIMIPDTVVFYNGEAKYIVYNGNVIK